MEIGMETIANLSTGKALMRVMRCSISMRSSGPGGWSGAQR